MGSRRPRKISYGHVARLGEIIRVAAAQDLFTDHRYSGQGIRSEKQLSALRLTRIAGDFV